MMLCFEPFISIYLSIYLPSTVSIYKSNTTKGVRVSIDGDEQPMRVAFFSSFFFPLLVVLLLL